VILTERWLARAFRCGPLVAVMLMCRSSTGELPVVPGMGKLPDADTSRHGHTYGAGSVTRNLARLAACALAWPSEGSVSAARWRKLHVLWIPLVDGMNNSYTVRGQLLSLSRVYFAVASVASVPTCITQ